MTAASLHVRLIQTADQLKTFCDSALDASFLTIDTEFMREKTYYPQLCLVQVATDKEAVVIDTLADGMDLSPLWDLFAVEGLPKVFHAASQDLEIFANLAGALPRDLFDTQIAAMVLGLGDQIGYDKLIKETTGEIIDKSSRYSDWAARPLSKRQIDYAAGDVTFLRDAYIDVQERIKQSGRGTWVDEEMAKVADLSRYQLDPMQVWKKLKVRSDKWRFLLVLQHLAAWRERDAQRRDLPRGRILRDDTLLDIAGSEPTSVDALKSVRGVTPKMAEGSLGKHIIRAVNEALAQPKESAPVVPRKKPLTDEQSAKLSLLKMLLSVCAANAGTAARLLANSADLEELARNKPETWSQIDVPCLSGWRAELFGDAALRLISGQIWIGFDQGAVSVRETAQL